MRDKNGREIYKGDKLLLECVALGEEGSNWRIEIESSFGNKIQIPVFEKQVQIADDYRKAYRVDVRDMGLSEEQLGVILERQRKGSSHAFITPEANEENRLAEKHLRKVIALQFVGFSREEAMQILCCSLKEEE